MRSPRWRSIQSGLPESAHGSPELVKHASLVEVDGMSRNRLTVPYSERRRSCVDFDNNASPTQDGPVAAGGEYAI